MDPLPAEMAGLDLGASGEPVGENGGSWVRAPDRRPQPVLGTGNRHVVVATLEAEITCQPAVSRVQHRPTAFTAARAEAASSARTGSQPNADPGLAFGPGLYR